MKGTMRVPTLNGRPEVTNSMKANCIGEFSFTIPMVCGECVTGTADKDCEVCAGEVEYLQSVSVPWDTCKEIYKAMANAANNCL